MNNLVNSYIDETSQVDPSVIIGRFCVIEENVIIGPGCILGNNITIHAGSIIGANVRIDDNTVIGKLPMRAANSAVTKEQELPPAEIMNDCIIGTNAVIYRGSNIGQKVLVADLSTIRENVTIGDFTIVGRGVAIENFCKIGQYCKLETNVYITAHSELEDYVFVAPCVATSNDNFVGRTQERFKHFKGVIIKRGGRIGVNATILPGKIIGEDSLVAAGAVVSKDTEPGIIVLGSPAKPLKNVPKEQLLDNQ